MHICEKRIMSQLVARSGNEEAGLFAREAAFLLLRHMYAAVPPADIKDRVLGGIGGNGVSGL